MKTASRKVKAATTADEAARALSTAFSVIDRAAAKGVLHPNAAARRKARLARLARAAGAGE